MVEVKLLPVGVDQGQYLFAVIAARYNSHWIWVKHRLRDTWEIPGGHIEPDELADDAAKRELIEETGAIDFKIDVVCDYWVRFGDKMGTSRLYFAEVIKIGELPESEIGCIDLFEDTPEKLTHPEIQPILFSKVKQWLAQP